MSTRKKVLVSAAVVVAVGVLAALGTYGAFTATTSNTGNSISSGTVSLTDTDGGSGKLVSFTGVAPGAVPAARCIRVQYTGSLNAAVKLYRTALNAGTGDDYRLEVVEGTMPSPPDQNMSCTGFSAVDPIYDTAFLGNLGTTYATGRSLPGTWTTGQSQVYRFQITVVDDSTPNVHTQDNSTGSFDFIFEAQSQ